MNLTSILRSKDGGLTTKLGSGCRSGDLGVPGTDVAAAVGCNGASVASLRLREPCELAPRGVSVVPSSGPRKEGYEQTVVRYYLVPDLGLVSGVRSCFDFHWNLAEARRLSRGSIFRSDLPRHVFYSPLPAYRRATITGTLVRRCFGVRSGRWSYLRHDLLVGTFRTFGHSKSHRRRHFLELHSHIALGGRAPCQSPKHGLTRSSCPAHFFWKLRLKLPHRSPLDTASGSGAV